MLAGGLSRRALVVGGDVLSKILDWDDRSTLVLFGDGAGAVVMEPRRRAAASSASSSAPTAAAASTSSFPGSGSRQLRATPSSILKMNGREVFKFATRVMVSSAEAVLAECGGTIDDVDVYVPHQANKRIIDHAVGKLGDPRERDGGQRGSVRQHVVGLDPARARRRAGRRTAARPGALVLMTGMGAGLTWGSALIEWTDEERAR